MPDETTDTEWKPKQVDAPKNDCGCMSTLRLSTELAKVKHAHAAARNRVLEALGAESERLVKRMVASGDLTRAKIPSAMRDGIEMAADIVRREMGGK